MISRSLQPAERVYAPVKTRIRVRDLGHDLQTIQVLAARDFKIKYKQSLLGPAWLIVQPLALLGALVVAFSGTARPHQGAGSYLAFALVGLCVWAYFQASVITAASSLISNEALVRRTPCSRVAFPIASTVVSLPILGVVLLGAVAVASAEGLVTPKVLLLPLALAWLLVFAGGAAWLVSAVAVHFRDVTSALPLVTQVGAFVAPVGYATTHLSHTLAMLVQLNPVTGVIEFWRWVLINGAPVQSVAAIASVVGTLLVVVVGWLVFSRAEPTMADVI